jgi:hypothetical protein
MTDEELEKLPVKNLKVCFDNKNNFFTIKGSAVLWWHQKLTVKGPVDYFLPNSQCLRYYLSCPSYNFFQAKIMLDNLSFLLLQILLTNHRIDFRGCCEKSELQERVKRLRSQLQAQSKIGNHTFLCLIPILTSWIDRKNLTLKFILCRHEMINIYQSVMSKLKLINSWTNIRCHLISRS